MIKANHPQRIRIIILCGLLMIFIFLSSILVLAAPQGDRNTGAIPTGVNSYASDIEYFESILSNPDLSSRDRVVISAKLMGLKWEATRAAQNSSTSNLSIISKKETDGAQLTAVSRELPTRTESPRSTGLLELNSTPLWNRNIFLTTVWIEKSGETYIKYLAGNVKGNVEDGVFVIYLEEPLSVITYYLDGMGSLKIVETNNDLVTIKVDNKNLYYDRKKDIFNDENGNEITIRRETPIPSYP